MVQLLVASMMRIYLRVSLLLFAISNSYAFRSLFLSRNGPVPSPSKMSLSMTNEVVVAGVAGGVAEIIFNNMQSSSTAVSAVFDQQPSSVVLKNKSTRLYLESEIESSLSTNDKIVVLVAEKSCDDDIQDEGPIKAEILIEKVAKVMEEKGKPKSVIVATSAASMNVGAKKNGFQFFSRGSAVEKAVTSLRSMEVPVSVIMYGDLLDQPQVPFLSSLLQEPELHPAYTLQSVLFSSSSSNQYIQTEPCTHAALSQTINRLLEKQLNFLDSPNGSEFPVVASELVVTSIDGPELNEKQWESLFQRVVNSGIMGAELLRVDFKGVDKKQQLLSWIANTWFPQALIDADAATILSGARPVRAVLLSGTDKVELVWEDLNMQTMKPMKVGALEITVSDSTKAGLSVCRSLGESMLPGEGLLMDKLVEGINKVVYKKQFASPLE